MPYSREFTLPPVVTELVTARNRLREHYNSASLKFTRNSEEISSLAGTFVRGDLGEGGATLFQGFTASMSSPFSVPASVLSHPVGVPARLN